MSLTVPLDEVCRRKKELTEFMKEQKLSPEAVVQLLDGTIRPVSIRTVKAWIADHKLSSARTPPLMLVDELQRQLNVTQTAAGA